MYHFGNKILASIIITILTVILISKFVNFVYYKTLPSHILVISSSESNKLSEKQQYFSKVAISKAVIMDQAGTKVTNVEIHQITSEKIKKLIENASSERGKQAIKKCLSCHSFEKNGPNKIGPNLFNVFDSKIASNSTYKYSAAMSEKNEYWSEENLFFFLHNPKKYLPGTKMAFPGIINYKEIADIIVFIKTNQDGARVSQDGARVSQDGARVSQDGAKIQNNNENINLNFDTKSHFNYPKN